MNPQRRLTALLLAAALLCGPQASARRGAERGVDLFQEIAGSWSGAGTVSLMGGGAERLRCRADYSPSDAAHLSLSLRCASDSFKLEIASNITREGNRIGGAWREASFGASGALNGTINGEQINAVIDGGGMSGRLSMSVHGNMQSVTLTSESTFSGTASVVMRRE